MKDKSEHCLIFGKIYTTKFSLEPHIETVHKYIKEKNLGSLAVPVFLSSGRIDFKNGSRLGNKSKVRIGLRSMLALILGAGRTKFLWIWTNIKFYQVPQNQWYSITAVNVLL